MELICPSCEARYGIPDGSIGEKGRQVSCMNCGHSWHAFPPLVLGAAQAAGSPSVGMQWRDPAGGVSAPAWEDRAGAASEGPASVSDAVSTGLMAATGKAAVSDAGPTPATGAAERNAASRSEQLMEIRETLAEIQSEERAAGGALTSPLDDAPPLTDFRQHLAGANDAESDRASFDEDTRERTRLYPDADSTAEDLFEDDPDDAEDGVDMLRKRMAQTAAREQAKPSDVRRLRKRHDRKVRRSKNNSAAGSGAFLTGFLLVAIIASVMISLYLLAPQIIERMPAAEKPMNEYVATIDGLRVSIAETYQGVAAWVSESLEGKV